MELSRQENWSGLPFPAPRDLPDPGIELGSPALQVDSCIAADSTNWATKEGSPSHLNCLQASVFLICRVGISNRTYTFRLLWGLHEIIHANHLELSNLIGKDKYQLKMNISLCSYLHHLTAWLRWLNKIASRKGWLSFLRQHPSPPPPAQGPKSPSHCSQRRPSQSSLTCQL